MNIFIVTSVTEVSNKPLCYSSVRSVYSTAERLQQTINTIQSINKYCPGAVVHVLEASMIDVSAYLQYTPFVHRIKVESDHANKSYSEVLIIQSGLKIITDMYKGLPYRLFKISGRYELNENFNLANISEVGFTLRYPQVDFYQHFITHRTSTCLYAVASDSIELFQRILQQIVSYFLAVRFNHDIETLLLAYLLPYHPHFVNCIGVQGYVAVNGKLIRD